MARLVVASVLLLATGCVSRDPASAPDGQQASKPSALGAKAENRNPRTATPFTVRRSLRVLRRADRDEQRTPLLNWPALSRCESGDNPRAVDPSGTYFGLYQFDLTTWANVGGQGNPADASPAEQTYRAELLYARHGSSPWPVCGRYL